LFHPLLCGKVLFDLLFGIYDLFFTWALWVSPHWRVTFFQQLKKVTKKSRPYSFAPRETFGVPEFSAIAYEPALMRRPGAQG